ncbi:hypothetical protein [Acinetobacter sp.]|uniref:hypothetical protein n=1 Tax=Acinetobacter sp. TaxID=472 RepID=UPI00289B13A1|nr:hypothetical protein [Acinetobacter sp.]
MKRPRHLPLYYEFLELFDNYEIQNWEAKQFWEKLNISQNNKNEKSKRLMYSGLRVLVQLQYLEVNPLISKKNIFSYTETPRMNELRNRIKKQKLEEIFSKKKTEFLDQIKDKENNIEFLESLLSDDKTLEKYFINYKEQLKNDIKNINSNIRLMNEIMNK